MLNYDLVGPTWEAASHESTREFMADLLGVFKKHGKALVPVDHDELRLNGELLVVPLDATTEKYAMERIVVEDGDY